jgi:ABC-type multidrug transport system fused ATPase/permease subunit
MNKHFRGSRFLGILVFLVIIALFSVAVMLLWNRLMPAIAGLPEISYLQAAGLFILARILFGGISGGMRGGVARLGLVGARGGSHNQIREKWMNMSEEERREFVRDRHFGHEFRDFRDIFGEGATGGLGGTGKTDAAKQPDQNSGKGDDNE